MMNFFTNALALELFGLIFVLFSVVSSVFGRQFPEGYYPGSPGNFYEQRQRDLEIKVKTAINKLKDGPQLVPDWPNPAVELGQVSGVALDLAGHVLVFHRGPNVWDVNTFTDRNIYRRIGDSAIMQPTVLVFNDTGDLVDHWGENLFYMPHGITVDKDNNVWVTDVALHQVFKFTPQQREKPALVLGEKFVPRDDDRHFCKPSAVAVLSTGDFFVADGYCNSRIIKFAADGTRILQWGSRNGDSYFVFQIPHALSLAEDHGLIFVADRERGRVAAFRSDNGTYVSRFKNWLMGPRIFSVAYAPVHGGRLYVVNGPTGNGDIPVRGYVIDFNSGRLIQTFAPENEFSNPHDIATSPDGSAVYVVELNPYKVYKFIDEEIRNETVKAKRNNVTSPAKPTATVEVSSTSLVDAGWGEWRGAAGAAAAAGVALLALAALALLRARNNGRKSVTRRRWEYGHGEFKLRRLLERRRFTRVHSEDSDEEPAPMLPPQPPANA